MSPNDGCRARGFTLVELLVAMAANLVVIALVVQAIMGLDRDHAVRQKVTALQGEARRALELMGLDLRHASLGSGTGVIWTTWGSNRVSRPAVQVFTAVRGGGSAALSDAKPGTDAVLVVEALPGRGCTATVGTLTTSTATFKVTDASAFRPGSQVLMGDFGDASWGTVGVVTDSGTVHELTLSETAVNVLPGIPVPRLGPGAIVRQARARLYYVDTADELVRLTLSVPRAPTAADIVGREVLGAGIENMQIDCQLDDMAGGFVACSDASNPAPVLSASGPDAPIVAEAATTFGAFTGGGPRFDAGNVSRLRALVVQVVGRSRTPLMNGSGDPAIGLTGASGSAVTLGPGGASGMSATSAFARRAYRVGLAARNTSLGSF